MLSDSNRELKKSGHPEITRGAAVIGVAVILSRILGLIREVFVLTMFDPWVTDAFFAALRIPSTLRRLFAEGALSAGVIPVFTRWLKTKPPEKVSEFAGGLLVTFFCILFVVSILGMLLSPLIVRLFTMGFLKNPEKLDLAIGLTRLMFPFILFIGIAALFAGLLNSARHFFLPALGPAVQNIVFILAALFICPIMGPLQQNMVYGLAIGVLVGSLLQVLIQLPAFKMKNLRFTFSRTFKHPAVKKVLLLMSPAIWGMGITQINLLVDQFLASWLGNGPISYLYVSTRLYQFPLGVFAVSISTVAFSHMSGLAAENDMEGLKNSLSYSLRQVFFIMVCSTAGLIALGLPLIDLLFGYGKFAANDSAMPTYYSLMAYSAGMFAYGGSMLFVRAFYSLKDMVTPVKISCVALLANVILNLILVVPFGYVGLAFATSISAVIGLCLLAYKLRAKIGRMQGREIFSNFIKTAVVSSVMFVVTYLSYKLLLYFEAGRDGLFLKFINLFVPMGIAGLLVFVLCRLLGIVELDEIRKAFSRRRNG